MYITSVYSKFPLVLTLATNGTRFILADLCTSNDRNELNEQYGDMIDLRTLYLVDWDSDESGYYATYISKDKNWRFTIRREDDSSLVVIDWKLLP